MTYSSMSRRSWVLFQKMVRSSSSRRNVPNHLSMKQFATGVRGGALATLMPSVREISSNAAVN